MESTNRAVELLFVNMRFEIGTNGVGIVSFERMDKLYRGRQQQCQYESISQKYFNKVFSVVH
jgi:hypothetical protein